VGDLIAVTAAEIRRLLTAFTHPHHPGEHYQRRLTNQPLPMRC
jgi:hypothetical protein